MPVNDFNAVKMGQEFTTIFSTTETVSEFWKLNAQVVAWVVIVPLLLGLLLFGFLFLIGKLKRLI